MIPSLHPSGPSLAVYIIFLGPMISKDSDFADRITTAISAAESIAVSLGLSPSAIIVGLIFLSRETANN